MDKLDYKKQFKDLYAPTTTPGLIQVPAMNFIMIDGKGDPNVEGGEYQQALGLLYPLIFTIKMSKMSGETPPGYFDYVLPPLEGFWWNHDNSPIDFAHFQKEHFCWTSFFRQPEYVTPEVFAWACESVRKKKGLDPSKARLVTFEEGLCAQVLHMGTYDSEGPTIEKLEHFIEEQGYVPDLSDKRRHHELYLSDVRKVAPEKNRTVIRLPIRKV